MRYPEDVWKWFGFIFWAVLFLSIYGVAIAVAIPVVFLRIVWDISSDLFRMQETFFDRRQKEMHEFIERNDLR